MLHVVNDELSAIEDSYESFMLQYNCGKTEDSQNFTKSHNCKLPVD